MLVLPTAVTSIAFAIVNQGSTWKFVSLLVNLVWVFGWNFLIGSDSPVRAAAFTSSFLRASSHQLEQYRLVVNHMVPSNQVVDADPLQCVIPESLTFTNEASSRSFENRSHYYILTRWQESGQRHSYCDSYTLIPRSKANH